MVIEDEEERAKAMEETKVPDPEEADETLRAIGVLLPHAEQTSEEVG
jgi:hypothetical protein